MGGAFQALTLDDIVEINRQMISRFGGAYFGSNRNLVNPGSLEHVLEEIQGSFFGQEPYPTIIEKAAVLGWRIIARHVFYDGNKRTGMEACRLLLDINGWGMAIDHETVDIALQIAQGQCSESDFAQWLRLRAFTIDPPSEPPLSLLMSG